MNLDFFFSLIFVLMKIRNVDAFTKETSDLGALFWKVSPFVALAVSAYPAILPKYMR
jgi:hypothetical protein